MSFLPKKFSLLLLLLTFTGAQPSNHNAWSILKTKFDAILNVPSLLKNRYARESTFECSELKDGIPPVDVINKPCKALTADPVYTLKVENVKGPKWDDFTSKVTGLSDIILEIDGSDIATLKLDNLKSIGGFKDVTIKNNKDLKEISFTVKENMLVGKLTITDNDELETVKISPALTFGCTEVIISKNPKLKTLEFVGAGTYTIPKMEISHNIQLTKISDNGKWKADGSLLIEDNRLLEEETLNRIKAINSGWNIQPFGHCIFDKPIQKLDELNSCVVVNQLKFAKGASGKIGDLKLNRVEDGDVVLADLPRDKAQFLEQVDGMTEISSDVCDFGSIKGINVTSPICPTTAAPATVASAPPTDSGPAPGPSSNSSSLSDAPSSPSQDPSWFRLDNEVMWVVLLLAVLILAAIGSVIIVCICKKYRKKKGKGKKPDKNGPRTPPPKSNIQSPSRSYVAPSLEPANPTPPAKSSSATTSAENAPAPTNPQPPGGNAQPVVPSPANPSPAAPSPAAPPPANPPPAAPSPVVPSPVVPPPAVARAATPSPVVQPVILPAAAVQPTTTQQEELPLDTTQRVGNIIPLTESDTLKVIRSMDSEIADGEEFAKTYGVKLSGTELARKMKAEKDARKRLNE